MKPQPGGIDRWSRFETPRADATEQVFFHSFTGPQPEVTSALVVGGHGAELAARLSWRSEELPYLVQWKLCRKGDYVLGIEPANCLVEGREWHRREKRPMLEPGASVCMGLRLDVIAAPDAISKAVREMQPA
jgi:hypothetical protein